eukprot:CAMPEP_0204331742 /NCGR_PEP_ID=MMETSP0469-20131031/15936_1 /ASSEMBLY_ACC=CAM_ASM_000384 /TAXON_ID=2969 /ORGANISM="Oxyrrhis marina" /LENGTH=311 /DNA_ID=CAMNT_0051314797 /DNA_START=31 /DNA_END=962 /DNA_ORIENTATION=-
MERDVQACKGKLQKDLETQLAAAASSKSGQVMALTVVGADELKGPRDMKPYVEISAPSTHARTKAARSRSPYWNHLVFIPCKVTEVVKLTVRDDKGHEKIGEALVELKTVGDLGWFGVIKLNPTGTLELRMVWGDSDALATLLAPADDVTHEVTEPSPATPKAEPAAPAQRHTPQPAATPHQPRVPVPGSQRGAGPLVLGGPTTREEDPEPQTRRYPVPQRQPAAVADSVVAQQPLPVLDPPARAESPEPVVDPPPEQPHGKSLRRSDAHESLAGVAALHRGTAQEDLADVPGVHATGALNEPEQDSGVDR